MLSFAEKQALFARYQELEAQTISLGRINYHYLQSKRDKQVIVKALHPNGNGFIYFPKSSEANPEGYINIRNKNAGEINQLLQEGLAYLSTDGREYQAGATFLYENNEQVLLQLKYENDMWVIYTGENVEAVLPSMAAAESYLRDEGFRSKA